MKWEITGFAGEDAFFSHDVTGGEKDVSLLLKLLIARGLTEDQLIDCIFGDRTDLQINRDITAKRYHLQTQGNDVHFIARRL